MHKHGECPLQAFFLSSLPDNLGSRAGSWAMIGQGRTCSAASLQTKNINLCYCDSLIWHGDPHDRQKYLAVWSGHIVTLSRMKKKTQKQVQTLLVTLYKKIYTTQLATFFANRPVATFGQYISASQTLYVVDLSKMQHTCASLWHHYFAFFANFITSLRWCVTSLSALKPVTGSGDVNIQAGADIFLIIHEIQGAIPVALFVIHL